MNRSKERRRQRDSGGESRRGKAKKRNHEKKGNLKERRERVSEDWAWKKREMR